METDLALERAIGLEFGPAVSVDLVHLVIALPGDLDGVGGAGAEDLAGDAAEGELAGAVRLEEGIRSSPRTLWTTRGVRNAPRVRARPARVIRERHYGTG